MSLSDPLPSRLRHYVEEEGERLWEPEVVGDFKETVSSTHNRTDAHMNSQRLDSVRKNCIGSSPTASQHREGEVDTKSQP